ncbi:MAG: hypothetical protein HQK50_14115, partial [Oligoflexia bacterium]|nr:hypothetical protein [Oligoflexia bacterium]
SGKGDVLITGDLVELKDKSSIKGEGDVRVYATDKINTEEGTKITAGKTNVVSATHVAIGGDVKGDAGTVIGGDVLNAEGTPISKLQNLTLANSSNIEGNYVQIQVAGAFASNGAITATGTPASEGTPSVDGTIILKLESDHGENIRGTLKANGWIMVDGQMSSNAIMALVVDRKDAISAQGVSVVTTEPIIIQKNIETNYGLRLSGASVDVARDTAISTEGELALTGSEGNVDLEAGSSLKAKKSVQIVAKGDIIRHGEERDDRSLALSIIEGGEDVLILSTDGSYKDTAATTRATGKIVIKTKNGIVITPIQQVFVSQTENRRWYGRKTITTTRTTYTGSKMDATEIYMDSGEGKLDISNLHVNGNKFTHDGSDFSAKNVYLKFPEGLISLEYLEDTVQSTSKRTYTGVMKPFVEGVHGVAKVSEQGKKLTGKFLRASEKILREVSKPITKNISGSAKYLDRLMKVTYSSNDLIWNMSNPEKFYKVGTYKTQYNTIKSVAFDITRDMIVLEKKLAKKINEEALSKLSKDLAKLVDNSMKIQDKGVYYVDAAASFENVARTALIAFANACGSGPAGTALANLIADRFIDKKSLNLKTFSQSVATGLAAGYAADYFRGCTSSLGTYGATFAGNFASNSITDAGDILFNNRSYSSTDFIAMTLRAGALSGINIKNGKDVTVGKIILTGAARRGLNEGVSELVDEAVVDHHVDLRDVGDAALRGSANGAVESTVNTGVQKFYDNLPERYKLESIMSEKDKKRLGGRIDLYFAERALVGLENGLRVLAEGLNQLESEDETEDNGQDERKEETKPLPSSSEATRIKSDPQLLGHGIAIASPDTTPGSYKEELDAFFSSKLTIDNDAIEYYRKEELDQYGFLKDMQYLEGPQKMFITEDLKAISPKASSKLRRQLNGWNGSELNDNQRSVLDQIDRLQSNHDFLNSMPAVTQDYADVINLDKLILSYSTKNLVEATSLSHDPKDQSQFDLLMDKSKTELDRADSLLSFATASSQESDPFLLDFHKGYYQGLLKGAQKSFYAMEDFFSHPIDYAESFVHFTAWAIENPKQALESYNKAAQKEMLTLLTSFAAKPEKRGAIYGEFIGSAATDFSLAEVGGALIKPIKNMPLANKLYKGATKPFTNERGSLNLFGSSSRETGKPASSINAGEALSSKLSALEKAQQTAAKVETLSDGRIRYYGKEVAARIEGPTRGASYVTEYNPKTAQVKSWMESYNHKGEVVRVHPKMNNGEVVDAPHFPLTEKEL